MPGDSYPGVLPRDASGVSAQPPAKQEVSLIMDALEVILAVEQGTDEYDEDQILEGIAEHRATLRKLQGSWGRLLRDLEERGMIPPE